MTGDTLFFMILACYDAMIMGIVMFVSIFIVLRSKDFIRFSKDIKKAKEMRRVGATVYILVCLLISLALKEKVFLVIFSTLLVAAFTTIMTLSVIRFLNDADKIKREKLSPFNNPDVK